MTLSSIANSMFGCFDGSESTSRRFTKLTTLFMEIKTKEESIKLQEEFLRVLEEAYTTYTNEPVCKYLHDDLHFHTFYTMKEMHSKDEYLDYLENKLSAMQRAYREYHFAMMVYNGGYPYLMVTNARDEQGGYMGFYVKNDKQGLITEIGMMPAAFMHVFYKNEEEKQKVEQYRF